MLGFFKYTLKLIRVKWEKTAGVSNGGVVQNLDKSSPAFYNENINSFLPLYILLKSLLVREGFKIKTS